MKKIIAEFKEFISKGNVLDMAVGLIVGSAFTAVVTALVSFLRSLISCFNIWGEPDTSFLDIHFLNGTIQLSALVEAVVSFLIIAVAVFFLVKGVNFLRSRAKKEEEEKKEQAKPDPQLELLTEIRDLLRQQAQTSAPEQEILPRLEEEEHGH
jgi:large conductance mechanosensitive channel protein